MEKEAYVEELKSNMPGLQMDMDLIERNEDLRKFAKDVQNSVLGYVHLFRINTIRLKIYYSKLGQQDNFPVNTMCYNEVEINKLFSNPTIDVHDFRIITKGAMEVVHKKNEQCVGYES